MYFVVVTWEFGYIKELEWENCTWTGKKVVPSSLSEKKTSTILSILFCYFSAQIKLTVQGLFDLNQNIPAFKEHLRDFMVQIKVGSMNL